jgi:hypothetical protein
MALIAAAADAQTGFWIGRRTGHRVLARTRNAHLIRGAARAEDLLARYGFGRLVAGPLRPCSPPPRRQADPPRHPEPEAGLGVVGLLAAGGFAVPIARRPALTLL